MYWYNKAEDLRAAAGLLWAGMGNEDGDAVAEDLGFGNGFSFRVACFPVYLMLCGLALELLLKAALVAQGRKPGDHHGLVNLWDEVGLARTPGQLGLLEILTESVRWAGRYPIPTKQRDFDRLHDLTAKHLSDPVATIEPNLVIRRRNAKLDWPSFNNLWAHVHRNPAIQSLFERPRRRSSRADSTRSEPETPAS
jgi:hypothetical protein